jgi:hypothetical protein
MLGPSITDVRFAHYSNAQNGIVVREGHTLKSILVIGVDLKTPDPSFLRPFPRIIVSNCAQQAKLSASNVSILDRSTVVSAVFTKQLSPINCTFSKPSTVDKDAQFLKALGIIVLTLPNLIVYKS